MSRQILTLQQIRIDGSASTKLEAIREAAEILEATGAVTAGYLPAMIEREKSVSIRPLRGLLDQRDGPGP